MSERPLGGIAGGRGAGEEGRAGGGEGRSDGRGAGRGRRPSAQHRLRRGAGGRSHDSVKRGSAPCADGQLLSRVRMMAGHRLSLQVTRRQISVGLRQRMSSSDDLPLAILLASLRRGRRCRLCGLRARQLGPLGLLGRGHLGVDLGPERVELDVLGLERQAEQERLLRLIQPAELKQRPGGKDDQSANARLADARSRQSEGVRTWPCGSGPCSTAACTRRPPSSRAGSSPTAQGGGGDPARGSVGASARASEGQGTHLSDRAVRRRPVAQDDAELLALEAPGLPRHALDRDLERERVELDRALKLFGLEQILRGRFGARKEQARSARAVLVGENAAWTTGGQRSRCPPP